MSHADYKVAVMAVFDIKFAEPFFFFLYSHGFTTVKQNEVL